MYLMGLIKERIAFEFICGSVSGTLYDNKHSIIGLVKFNEGVHSIVFFSQRDAKPRSGTCPWHMFVWYTLHIYMYVKNLCIAQVLQNLMQIRIMSEYIYGKIIYVKIMFYLPFLWLFVAEAFTQFGRIATNLGASDWDLKTHGGPDGWKFLSQLDVPCSYSTHL